MEADGLDTYRVRLRITVPLLLLLTILESYAVLFLSTPIAQSDRAGRDDRNIFFFIAGVLGLAFSVYATRHKAQNRSEPDGALGWLAVLLPCYAAFQLLPLPLFALRILSPARAKLAEALTPVGLGVSFAPLSVTPSLSLVHFLLFASYGVVFLLVRKIARWSGDAPWLPVLPILGIAAWQGAWGVQQFLEGGAQPFAHGTYPVKNHFAGLLEMSLPFAIAFGAAALVKGYANPPLSLTAALKAGGGFSIGAIVIVGILTSLSRMGLVASIGSVFVMGALALAGKMRWPLLLAWGAATTLAFAFMAPVQLVLRFSEISSEGRIDVWKDTLHLIAAYPIFGTGLGGYQSAFERFKTSGFAAAQDYAHNDYLQFFAELGLTGFLIGGIFLFLILVTSVRASLQYSNPDARWIAVACSGALVAILIHSVADFNLYVPANAMLLAWICGVAAGEPAD